MLSSSDAGRLMIAANFSNLKPLVRISFCFRPARLYTLHGESVAILFGQPKNVPNKTLCRIWCRVPNQE